MYATFFALALLPVAFALADQAAQPTQQPGKAQLKAIDRRDIPLEDLAHAFFFHSADQEMLESIVSDDGIRRLEPELAELRREMTDLQKIAPKARQMCRDLQNAKSGHEFAAVFIEAEEAQQNESSQHARRILSKLGDDDRMALERYLDTEYRQGQGRTKFDYEAMYASGPFPSPDTNLITLRTCDSAAEIEARVEQ